VPILSTQPGFVSYAVIDAGLDVEISISVYTDRSAAETANRAAASWVEENLADLVGPVEVTMGERLVTATASPERQNLSVVRQGYDAFGRGDIPGILALLDPQVSWTTPGPADLPTAGVRRGHQAVSGFFQSLTSIGDVVRFEPKEFLAEGNRVVVLGDDTTRVHATDKMVEFRWTHVFTMREGKVVAFEEIGDVSALVAELRSAHAKL
jgi:ketosteroid isomerase-like protein